MSEQFAEAAAQAQEPEAIDLPSNGDAAFGLLMDTLVAEDAGTEAGAGDEPPTPDAAAAGSPAATAEGTGAAESNAEPPAAGAGGEPAIPGDGGGDPSIDPAGGDGARPTDWTASASDLTPRLGQLSTALEERTTQAYQQSALEEVREEHSKYFEALNTHPRLLVGKNVPRIGGEGEETLRDTADAREWQEAVKTILVEEIKDRASRALEENSEFLSTVHASIELFQNNADLVPGTKDFDVDLANQFAAMAKPYELRVEGKLQGYSIPVQPIINQLRANLVAARQAKPAAPAAPAAAAATPPADPPQAGIQSKAGNSTETEDFSTLFGTLGIPDFRI